MAGLFLNFHDTVHSYTYAGALRFRNVLGNDFRPLQARNGGVIRETER